MYTSYEQAGETLFESMGKVWATNKIPTDVSGLLASALKADTAGKLHRVDYLERDRFERYLKGELGEAITDTINLLFPRTMRIVQKWRYA